MVPEKEINCRGDKCHRDRSGGSIFVHSYYYVGFEEHASRQAVFEMMLKNKNLKYFILIGNVIYEK